MSDVKKAAPPKKNPVTPSYMTDSVFQGVSYLMFKGTDKLISSGLPLIPHKDNIIHNIL